MSTRLAVPSRRSASPSAAAPRYSPPPSCARAGRGAAGAGSSARSAAARVRVFDMGLKLRRATRAQQGRAAPRALAKRGAACKLLWRTVVSPSGLPLQLPPREPRAMSRNADRSSYSMREQILRESIEMIRFAFASGKSGPTSVGETVERYQSHPIDVPNLDAGALVLAHSRLTKIVAPATPRSIVLLADESTAGGRWSFLGPVGLVRRLMVVAITSVLVFILISLSKLVNVDEGVTVTNTAGFELLVNELFWLAAAAVGASFAMLFEVNDFIVRCTYDPKYEPSYWIKLLLGVMAGFILVMLVPIKHDPQAALELARPTIAMLGGYSASAVYRILSRLVETVESLFRGNAKDLIAEREQSAAARAAEESSRTRVTLAGRVVDLPPEVGTRARPPPPGRNPRAGGLGNPRAAGARPLRAAPARPGTRAGGAPRRGGDDARGARRPARAGRWGRSSVY